MCHPSHHIVSVHCTMISVPEQVGCVVILYKLLQYVAHHQWHITSWYCSISSELCPQSHHCSSAFCLSYLPKTRIFIISKINLTILLCLHLMVLSESCLPLWQIIILLYHLPYASISSVSALINHSVHLSVIWVCAFPHLIYFLTYKKCLSLPFLICSNHMPQLFQPSCNICYQIMRYTISSVLG
jgi:hypothetical protein